MMLDSSGLIDGDERSGMELIPSELDSIIV